MFSFLTLHQTLVLTDKVVNEVDLPLALADKRRRLLLPLPRRATWVLAMLRRHRCDICIGWCLGCLLCSQQALGLVLLLCKSIAGVGNLWKPSVP